MKKLLVILGAGSSVSLGMPSVNSLNKEMQNWAADWTRLDGEACQPNYFEHAWNALEAHYGHRPGGLVRQPNFEVALGLLTGLSNWVRPAPYGQPLRDLVEANGELPGFFSEERLTGADITGFGPSSSVRRQYVTLLVRLAKHMRRQCQARRVNTSPKQVTYRQIMDALCEHFDVGIYNLNYDNVALHACAGAFTGFSDEMDSDGFRHFEPGAVHAREQWGFVYHLHGSVHHTLPSREKGLFDRKMMWQDDLAAPNFCDGEEEGSSVLDERSDRTEIPPTTLVAGGFKLDQLLVEPFHSFHASLVRHAHEADAILIAGYGLADVHVNRALLSRMTNGKSRPRTAILEFSEPIQEPTCWRNDSWTRRLLLTLKVGSNEFTCYPGTVRNFKNENWFELAGGHTTLWHNGFLEVHDRLADLINWLHGQPTELGPARQ